MEEKKLNQKEIGLRIKIIRKELGLTMKEFGQKFIPPASDSIVSRWERGVSSPNAERLQKIANLGNVSLFYLTTGRKDSKDLADVTLDDGSIKETLGRVAVSLNEATKKNKKKILEDFKNIEIDKLDFIETTYLINVLNFLRYSDKEDIMKLTAIIRMLNSTIGEYTENVSVTQKEIREFIDGEMKDIQAFLEKRFDYKGGE